MFEQKNTSKNIKHIESDLSIKRNTLVCSPRINSNSDNEKYMLKNSINTNNNNDNVSVINDNSISISSNINYKNRNSILISPSKLLINNKKVTISAKRNFNDTLSEDDIIEIVCKGKKFKNYRSLLNNYLNKNKRLTAILSQNSNNNDASSNFINSDMVLYNLTNQFEYKFKKKNSYLFNYGDTGDKFYVIIKGNVNILIPVEVNYNMSYYEYISYLIFLYTNNELASIDKCLENNKNELYVTFSQIERLTKIIKLKLGLNYETRKDTGSTMDINKIVSNNQQKNSNSLDKISIKKYYNSNENINNLLNNNNINKKIQVNKNTESDKNINSFDEKVRKTTSLFPQSITEKDKNNTNKNLVSKNIRHSIAYNKNLEKKYCKKLSTMYNKKSKKNNNKKEINNVELEEVLMYYDKPFLIPDKYFNIHNLNCLPKLNTEFSIKSNIILSTLLENELFLNSSNLNYFEFILKNNFNSIEETFDNETTNLFCLIDKGIDDASITYKTYTFKEEEFLFNNKKNLKIFKFKNVKTFKSGDIFGEVALQTIKNKRTASIFVSLDTHLLYLIKSSFDKSIGEVQNKVINDNLKFLKTQELFFKLYPTELLYENFYNLFNCYKESFGFSILKQNNIISKTTFIKEGEFEVSLSATPQMTYEYLKFYNNKMSFILKNSNYINFYKNTVEYVIKLYENLIFNYSHNKKLLNFINKNTLYFLNKLTKGEFAGLEYQIDNDFLNYFYLNKKNNNFKSLENVFKYLFEDSSDQNYKFDNYNKFLSIVNIKCITKVCELFYLENIDLYKLFNKYNYMTFSNTSKINNKKIKLTNLNKDVNFIINNKSSKNVLKSNEDIILENFNILESQNPFHKNYIENYYNKQNLLIEKIANILKMNLICFNEKNLISTILDNKTDIENSCNNKLYSVSINNKSCKIGTLNNKQCKTENINGKLL